MIVLLLYKGKLSREEALSCIERLRKYISNEEYLVCIVEVEKWGR